MVQLHYNDFCYQEEENEFKNDFCGYVRFRICYLLMSCLKAFELKQSTKLFYVQFYMDLKVMCDFRLLWRRVWR